MTAHKTEFLSLLNDAICAIKQELASSCFCFGNHEDIAFFKTLFDKDSPKEILPSEKLEHLQTFTDKKGNSRERKDIAVVHEKIASAIYKENKATNPFITVGQKLNENENKAFPKVETPPPLGSDTDLQIRAMLKKTAPNLRLCTHVPSDAQAKQISEGWKEQFYNINIAVLALGETGSQLQFLQNLTKAIDINIRPSKTIDGARLEKEKKWELFLAQESLKWIVCSPQIYQFPELMRFFKELPATKEFFLHNKKLLILHPISSYFSTPELKASLWQTIKNL